MDDELASALQNPRKAQKLKAVTATEKGVKQGDCSTIHWLASLRTAKVKRQDSGIQGRDQGHEMRSLSTDNSTPGSRATASPCSQRGKEGRRSQPLAMRWFPVASRCIPKPKGQIRLHVPQAAPPRKERDLAHGV